MIELPTGPSGRKPEASIRLRNSSFSAPEWYLVLFNDGTMGTWYDTNSSISGKWIGNHSTDGSEYTMKFHSLSQFGKIDLDEDEKISSNWEKMFIGLSLMILSFYLTLFMYSRIKSEWPEIIVSDSEIIFPLLFCFPMLMWYFHNYIFNFYPVDIVLHVANIDPHYFPIKSHKSQFINSIHNAMIVSIFASLFAIEGNLFGDAILILSLIFIFLNHPVFKPILNWKNNLFFDDSAINILKTEEFIKIFNDTCDTVQSQKRIENPLLILLMGNESAKLEFKASLWAEYHGVTEKPVEDQKSKKLELQDSVLKTVAAFLNTDGGTLLIGIKDKPRDSGDKVAEVLGIDPDFKWLKKGKRDEEGYSHVLIELFNNSLTNDAANQYIKISFPRFENKTICRIDVDPLPRILGQQCFANTQEGKKLFVRSGDSSIPQSRETEYDYIRHHFEGFSGKNNKS
ncbi:ATP-binding protein [Euryarchaeota archaeon]|nr:ATP-binding protein [Euryarchaeota archaeon]